MILLRICVFFSFAYYAPNFEEVEGAYWFGPVRPSVRLSDRNTFLAAEKLKNP